MSATDRLIIDCMFRLIMRGIFIIGFFMCKDSVHLSGLKSDSERLSKHISAWIHGRIIKIDDILNV